MSHEMLTTEMAAEHRKWAISTKVYGTLYPGFRFYLIVASGIVAAKDSLASFQTISMWVPLLAVSVTVITAVDTWLKPRDKWRGFMKDRDDLAALRIRAGVSPQDTTKLERLNTDFAELRRRHRDENVW
jgi:hypothetical protein